MALIFNKVLFLFAVSIIFLPNFRCLKQRMWVGPWQFFEGSAPSPRFNFGFAAQNKELFVHGGEDLNGNILSELHQFNIITKTWSDLSDSTFGIAPSPRSGHTLVTIKDNFVVFGGAFKDQWFNDLFTFEPQMLLWTNISAQFEILPPVRTNFAYAVIDSKLYIFGGYNHEGCLNDFFFLDIRNYIYTVIETPHSPEARWGSALASVGSVLYLYGGRDCSDLYEGGSQALLHGDFYSFDTSTLSPGQGSNEQQWIDLDKDTGTTPGNMSNHALVSIGEKVYLYGGDLLEGDESKNSSDVFLYDPTTSVWTNLTPSLRGAIPPPRNWHGAIPVGESMYIFGGIDLYNLVGGRRTTRNDMYQLNLSDLIWHDFTGIVRGSPPNPRRAPYMASAGEHLMILGGRNKSTRFYDLFLFNLETLTWSSSEIRIDNNDVQIAGNRLLFSLQERFYVLFSEFPQDYMNNMYEYDPSLDVWTNVSSKLDDVLIPPRLAYYMAITESRIVYFFGGFDGFTWYNDLYALDISSGTSWNIPATGSPPSPRCCFGFAAAGEQLFVFGGTNDETHKIMGDLHRFDTSTNTWTDLTAVQKGDVPSQRDYLGFVSFGKFLYLFGGAYSGLFNDLYQLDPVSLKWIALRASNLPFARQNFAMAANSEKIFVFGGTNLTGDLNDLHSIIPPQHLPWPLHTEIFSALVDVFDWDTLVPSLNGSILASSLYLGTGLIPSTLVIQGPGLLIRQGNGSIVCLVTKGCSNVDLQSVTFRCNDNVSFNPFLKMESTVLRVWNSSFSNCRSMADGGIIQAYNRAAVALSGCKFESVHSSGHGGAVSAVGSKLMIDDTVFHDAASDSGGGAVWASSFLCFGFDQGLLEATSIDMSNVKFEKCSSAEQGGAILASSPTVVIHIVDADFSGCSAGNYGGAVSLDSAAKALLLNVSMVNNTAFGIGGGAFHVDGAQLHLNDVTCNQNSAPAGGGGVVFWDGETAIFVEETSGKPLWDVTTVNVDEMRSIEICSTTNTAVYGSCFATPFRSLQLDGLPSSVQPAYPGLPFTVQVIKRDIYGQKIASDSTSVLAADSELWSLATAEEGSISGLSTASTNPDVVMAGQTVMRLSSGQAEFALSLQPSFTNLSISTGSIYLKSRPYIRVHGTDLQTFKKMAAPAFDPFIPAGRGVCPRGYILSLATASGGSLQSSSRTGQCHWCQAGTYSVDPLGGINEPSCYNCPLGGMCAGGANVTFAVGDWLVIESSYRLVACPSGHSLMNTIGNIFQHDIQRCVPCGPNQYVINSSNPLYSCQDCPAGAYCNGYAVLPRVPGSVFSIDLLKGKYILASCPPGYYLDEFVQACTLCPPGFYCLGGAFPKDTCRPGTFSRAGANASQACQTSVFVLATITLPVSRAQFEGLRDKYLDAIMATVELGPDHVVIESINRRRQILVSWLLDEATDAFEYKDAANGSAKSRAREDLELTNKAPPHTVGSSPAALISGRFIHSTAGERRVGESVQVVTKLVTADAGQAAKMSARMASAGQQLNTELLARGVPAGTISAVEIAGTSVEDSSNKERVVIGAIIGGIVLALSLGAIAVKLYEKIKRKAAYREFVAAFKHAEPGGKAQKHHLPLALQAGYIPQRILGKGAFACVVEVTVRMRDDSKMSSSSAPLEKAQQQGTHVAAIKLVLPAKARDSNWKKKKKFDQSELEQLHLEHRALKLMKVQHCNHAVHELGLEAMHMTDRVAWFIMDRLEGENLSEVLRSGDGTHLFDDVECIKVARNVLAALKVLHDNGLTHRDIKPANIMRVAATNSAVSKERAGRVRMQEYTYKIIDFGCCMEIPAGEQTAVLDIEDSANARPPLPSRQRRAWEGTPAYMSPETARNPRAAGGPRLDIWALGATLFELATGELPFPVESSDSGWDQEAFKAKLLDDGCPVPNLLDRIPTACRATFDHNLAQVVWKALKKRPEERYESVDEMHNAVYQCLISKGEATYSVFISYRVASEAYLARILYDELNHTVTPGGHRVTIYWDAVRLVKGGDWELGFSTGLLNSLCFFPILSYGSTAPMAALPEKDMHRLLANGWDAKPVGRSRLAGTGWDVEDNLLKEFLIAETLAERGQVEDRPVEEQGKIQLIYPILVGRLHPPNHPAYPGMGDFFQVQGGGGQFQKTPSLATNQAVASFLEDKGRLPKEVTRNVLTRSVHAIITGLTKLQGCQLWRQAIGFAAPNEDGTKSPVSDKVELTKEQMKLLGTGCTGPPVDLSSNGSVVPLSDDQRDACQRGVNEEQMRFAKAAVRASIRDFHDVIDRAVASYGASTAKRTGADSLAANGDRDATIPGPAEQSAVNASATSSLVTISIA